MTAPGAGFRLTEVSVFYNGHPALDRISLDVAPGGAVGLVGPSGSGKTTLLRLLNGAVRPDRGRVEFNGRALSSLSPGELRRVRASVGFVHQDLRLMPNLSVAQNVIAGRLGRLSFPASARALLFPSKEYLLEAHAILERVGIPEKLYQRSDTLSGGQRQRVAIARALFQEPAAILADEPVSSVDPARARDTVGLLADICRERGLTLVMSLHNLDLARETFPRLVGLRRGRVVFDQAPSRISGEAFTSLYKLAGAEMLDA